MSYRQDILDDLSLTMALVDKNISRIDFSGEDFSNCAFSGVNFSNCNLQGVNFTSCQIANCDFSGADMTGANAMSTQWYEPIFKETKIRDVDFRAVQMSNSTISDAILDGEKTSPAIFNEIHFENVTITGRIERLIANNSIFDGMTANSVM